MEKITDNLRNIKYLSPEIANFYKSHRCSWNEFYLSERTIFEAVAKRQNMNFGTVLDVGCAAGGLAYALSERFHMVSYLGIDINEQAINVAKERPSNKMNNFAFKCGDIVELYQNMKPFDTVFALSCADWNINTRGIINSCWKLVKPQGHLIISLRLTPHETINDFTRSYQFVRFDGHSQIAEQEEKANYVVFNILDALSMFKNLDEPPGHVLGYGYWGRPSKSAVTPYKELVFGVFALKKSENESSEAELCFPLSLFCQ